MPPRSMLVVILPLHLGLVCSSKVISSLALWMEHFNDSVPVLLRAATVPLESLASDDSVSRERGRSQGVTLHLTAETVEDKVGQEDEISLVGGGLWSRGSEDQPTTHHRGGWGRNLERAQISKHQHQASKETMKDMQTLEEGDYCSEEVIDIMQS